MGTKKYLTNGLEMKKIALVTKQTKPKELFSYFQSLLQDYSYHFFMAKWQQNQMDSLIAKDEVIYVHDYSEGYSCR